MEESVVNYEEASPSLIPEPAGQAGDPPPIDLEELQPSPDGLEPHGSPSGLPAASAAVADREQALELLAAEVESLRLQLEERNAHYMRIAADFDNFRKRNAREKEELEQHVKRHTLSELLPVIDSFERARSQIKPKTDGETVVHNNYQGVYKQLVECLKRIGVSPMRPKGQPFDPNYHDAVMREATDQHPEGTVLEELQQGYLLGDKVLRHAMVKVATAPEDGSATSAHDVPEETPE
ncbi:nucleotide exchange factor GrpE [Synechococcales cyanobacterium C]|uniref:Protein GrpE n=1 Tax=Petrachloros mirabilis ULC683 TaxID=2781853 RepID=A0A8K2A767_9CYAN|nr:nucleotide exchange factor GrpE [Petrachloros mirabilis ULC683]